MAALLALHSHAAELWVPQEYPSIQAAVDAAADGDIVTVAPGDYLVYDPIDFNRFHDPDDPSSPSVKNLTLRSSAGPEGTTIRFARDYDPTDIDLPKKTQFHNVVRFVSGETSSSRLEGFTLTGGLYDTPPTPRTAAIGLPWNYQGGGIYIRTSSPVIGNCVITGNGFLPRSDPSEGGGVFCEGEGASPQFVDCVIRGNTADYGSGAFCGWGSSPSFINCEVTGNNVDETGWFGAAVHSEDAGTPLFAHCLISGNQGGGVRSGGYYAGETHSPEFRDCRITDNADYGVYNDYVRVLFQDCEISRNGGDGILFGGYATFIRSDISENAGWGIAESSYGHVPSTYVSCTIRGNAGGGVGAGEGDRFINCLIAKNAGHPWAVAYSPWHGVEAPALFQNCTIVENEAGGVNSYSLEWNASNYAPAVFVNSIIWGNAGPAVANQSIEASFSCIEGDHVYPGEGNINRDPLLGPRHRLTAGSPCIDAGDNSAVAADFLDLDGDGDRTEPIPTDLWGGHRHWDESTVADTGVGEAPLVDMGASEYRLFKLLGLGASGDRDLVVSLAADPPASGHVYRLMRSSSLSGPWTLAEEAHLRHSSDRVYQALVPKEDGADRGFFRLIEIKAETP